MVTTQISGMITIRTITVPFERLEKVHVPDKDSLEQRMNISHGQLSLCLYRDNRKFRIPLQLFV